MRRLHIHISVEDLGKSRIFYEAIFGVAPTKIKEDYLQWLLDDPSVNFAISVNRANTGLNHLGIQVESDDALLEIQDRLTKANIDGQIQDEAECCYASSKKYWAIDPQNVIWENYHTMEQIEIFGGDSFTGGVDCCTPTVSDNGKWSTPKHC